MAAVCNGQPVGRQFPWLLAGQYLQPRRATGRIGQSGRVDPPSRGLGMTLDGIRHWVFDMDGTLTVPVHDFAAIKRELDIPQDHDILGHLAALPAEESAAKHAWL
ncbi:hypothetical protein ALO66_05453, partial [Pseudomonas coronafaciens pv. atropurpurea]